MGSKRRVLIVDDHPPMRHIVERFLRSRGFRTHTADNGAEALAYLAENRPEMVVTDFIMPQVDGLQMLAGIRRIPGLEDLPVLFVTAVDQPELGKSWAQVGVTNMIAKPFRKEQLVRKVIEMLDGPEAAAAAI